MPVKAVGRRIVEISTGKTVATASSHANAVKSARARNAAYRAKQQGKKWAKKRKT